MTGVVADIPKKQFLFDGEPLANGTLTTSLTGTSTLSTTWQDEAQTIANTNPIVLNSQGECDIWLQSGTAYRLVLKNSLGATIWTVDNVQGAVTGAALSNEWIDTAIVPTFISATSFSMAGDQTVVYHVGRRVKVTDGANTFYGTITASVFSTVTTVTVKLDSGSLTASLSAVNVGIVSFINSSVNQRSEQLTTNQNFVQNGAIVNRMGDRLFVGGATSNDGLFPNIAKDWFTTYQNTLQIDGSASFLSGTGLNSVSFSINNTAASSNIGGAFSSRSLNFTTATPSCIGVAGFAVNNNATLSTNCWGGYFEAHRDNNVVGAARGIEVDVRSLKTVELKANAWAQSQTSAIQIGAGCGISATVPGTQTNIGAAIQVLANPLQFKAGIMFSATSIEGCDGLGATFGTAFTLAPGHAMEWYNSAQVLCTQFTSLITTAANRQDLVFTNSGFQVKNAAGNIQFIIDSGVGSINRLTVSPSLTTVPVTVGVNGTDANIDLQLTPKGTGLIRFGVLTVNADAPITGYVSIKTQDGTTRKLAVIA